MVKLQVIASYAVNRYLTIRSMFRVFAITLCKIVMVIKDKVLSSIARVQIFKFPFIFFSAAG